MFVYVLFVVVLTAPYWGGQCVIAPYRQHIELGAADSTGACQIENRKFSDYSNGYIPEITAHLSGKRSGWLSLWTDQNELGRPLYHISGFSSAYFITWMISSLVSNSYVFITILSLLTVFFSGVFILLYCREIDLNPVAGMIAAISMATCPMFMYWLTFPMFPSVWCWAAGALWGIARTFKKKDLIGWAVLAFSVNSLLLTAYPQPVVFHAYILSGLTIYYAYNEYGHKGWKKSLWSLFCCFSAVCAGVALSLPVYLDLMHTAAESARINPELSFFTSVLPRIESLHDAIRTFVLSTTPEIFGNPIRTSYPFPYDGLSITLLMLFYAVLGLITAFRKTWGWWLAVVIFGVLTFSPSIYSIGVKYLGFSMSRSIPSGSIMLPLVIIIAHGVDALMKRPGEKINRHAIGGALLIVLSALAANICFGLCQDIAICWSKVLAMGVICALLIPLLWRTRPLLLILTQIVSVGVVSCPLMFSQKLDCIATTSPLVELIREEMAAASRFAVATPGATVLSPNLNASVGLPSIHSYNSLSSRRYHYLIETLGGLMHTHGRYNGTIAPDYDGLSFWMSNIGLILSVERVAHENLTYVGEESGIYVYKVISRMGEAQQVRLADTRSSSVSLDVRKHCVADVPSKVLDQGDILEFEVTPQEASVLVLSQKFHRDWQAVVVSPSGEFPARTIEVNGVFQGVILPENVLRVRLEYKPYARYAWLCHVVVICMVTVLGIKRYRRLQRKKE